MEIHLFPTDRAPRPANEVRIETLEAVPYPDRFRIHVRIKVTPFQERPNLLLTVHDADSRLVNELSIIETMHFDMEFTIHLRGRVEPAGAYILAVELFYQTRNHPQDRQEIHFSVPQSIPGTLG